VENPYFQYFCGEESSEHALVFDSILDGQDGDGRKVATQW
jgi:hypothetical protein